MLVIPLSSYSPASDWTDDQFLLELISRICASDLFRLLYSNCISLNRWVDQYLGTWHINYLGIGLVRLIQLGSSRPQVPLQWDRQKIIGYKWSTDGQRISIQIETSKMAFMTAWKISTKTSTRVNILFNAIHAKNIYQMTWHDMTWQDMTKPNRNIGSI